FSSRRRHTRFSRDWSSDVCSSDLSSLAAFDAYQNESAWVWEHQALTRARFSAGDASIGARFEAIRRRVLARPRELGRLREEVREIGRTSCRERVEVWAGGGDGRSR